MKQNRGQVLVLFLLLLPFILIFMALIIDYGLLTLNKSKLNKTLDKTLENAVEYNLSEDEINNLINKNIDDISYIDIKTNEREVKIHIKKNIKTGFINIYGKNLTEFDITKTKNKKE